jgi:hypothetical protein
MCHGEQSRLRDLKIPKQLLPLPLCNTTILGRTLAMLTGTDEVGEIVVIGDRRFAQHLFGKVSCDPAPFLLSDWRTATAGKWINAEAEITSRTIRRPRGMGGIGLEIVSMVSPGNSVIRGLRAIRAYLAMTRVTEDDDAELYDRTVILLGDVVYSRRCLAALVPKICNDEMWFVVSPDLTASTGEVFGCSYDREGTAEFLSILDAVPHPPFTDTYQPGQLRRLLWERQRRQLEAAFVRQGVPAGVAAVARQASHSPAAGCCSVMDDDDYTCDFDTVDDLEHLGRADVAAFRDGELPVENSNLPPTPGGS